MKAFNESTEKRFSDLASSFSLTEKSGVEAAQAVRPFYYDTHDERS